MSEPGKPAFGRILLKLSGESLAGDQGFGIDSATLIRVAGEIKEVVDDGCQVAIVVGGGNIFRGISAASKGMERVSADHMGMLATVINSLALQNALENIDVPTRVQTAVEMKQFAEPYSRRRAVRHLEKGRVVIFGAGTGNPFFTTDTAASLRAFEVNADAILKATKVDGVFDDDPMKNKNAHFIPKLTYMDVINNGYGVMDMTSITMCREKGIPIIVFNFVTPGNLKRVVAGENIGTKVSVGG